MTRIDKIKLEDNEGVAITSYANIFYYSGFTSDDAVLFLTKNRRILVTDARYTFQARNEAKDFEIRDITEGLDKIAKELSVERLGFEEDYLTVKRFSGFRRFEKQLVPMQTRISLPRRIKDAREIECIRRSEELASAAYEYTIEHMRAGMTEKEVALLLENFMRRGGASKTSFDTIVASGVRSSMPHGVASYKVIEKGDFVTMDFGCILDGYCSDMTRTVLMGTCSDTQKEIYEVVLSAQLAAIDAIEKGKRCADIDKAARDIIDDAGYGANFGHSLGHSVGIEIHESPNFSAKSEDIIEVGNVITVEPGIYIDGFGGVRIEDVVAIGEKVENLTKSCKKLTII